ncbi:MAG: hypothetical protein K8M05_25865, partial [Deltaproteobacteria bacterium]|nr:hypothetical protein [Kofleriaceae bacterium]
PMRSTEPTPPPRPDGPWRPGQPVRHPRYGVGTVLRIGDDAVDCDFGKLGPRSFPLRMCPLTAAGPP